MQKAVETSMAEVSTALFLLYLKVKKLNMQVITLILMAFEIMNFA